ncbi:MAG: hypothetical protein HFH32_17965 [Eubacterium sp.]|jgi:hypothetical protein|nr:hypothetical protein [Eubacterium sp.]
MYISIMLVFWSSAVSAACRKHLADEIRLAMDAGQWVESIQEYKDTTELDASTYGS